MDSRALSAAPHSEAKQGGRREERKQRTRRALLDAALGVLEHRSFGSLSLRQVTREAGVVPTAFYRHFPDMDVLGVELVEESVGTLRRMIRGARDETPDYGLVIERSVEILVSHVHAHRAHFWFIARERSSGVPAVRLAIREQFALFVSELATDLQRFGVLTHWSLDDRLLLADIIVNQMISTAEAILETPPDAEAEVIARAERQLRMIVTGLSRWHRSNPSP